MNIANTVRKQKYLSFTVVLFTLSIGVLIGTAFNTTVKAAKEQNAAPGATPLVIPSPVQLQNAFSALAKQLEPSVVNISTEYIPSKDTTAKKMPKGHPRVPNGEEGEGTDDGMQQFMQRFFGGQGGGGMDMSPRQDQKSESLGSGVVVDKNGYILTNNHVVEKATRMKVKFTGDDTEYEAKLIGTDPVTDLAVIHINRTDLKAAKVGNSDAVQVGDWAVAIGSPFGFQATVTAGIISAKTRHLEDGPNSAFQSFLQTDAAINPGNSGGPLLNINGEVIGINTMIASRSGGYQGIGFAMPINTAVNVYNEIIKTGHITRGSIGISFRERPETKDLLKASGAKEGVFVETVEPEGPSAKAGLKSEDVIVSINNKPVKNGQDLIDTVSTTPVGTKLKLGIIRDFASKTIEVSVGDRNKIFASTLGGEPKSVESEPSEPTQAKFGISIRNLTDGLRQNMNFKGKGGVLVDSVEQGSFADEIGLAKGDIIESMTANNARVPISNVDDIKNIQTKLKSGDSVAFRIMRSPGMGRGGDWQQTYLAGKLPLSGQ